MPNHFAVGERVRVIRACYADRARTRQGARRQKGRQQNPESHPTNLETRHAIVQRLPRPTARTRSCVYIHSSCLSSGRFRCGCGLEIFRSRQRNRNSMAVPQRLGPFLSFRRRQRQMPSSGKLSELGGDPISLRRRCALISNPCSRSFRPSGARLSWCPLGTFYEHCLSVSPNNAACDGIKGPANYATDKRHAFH